MGEKKDKLKRPKEGPPNMTQGRIKVRYGTRRKARSRPKKVA